jgi:2-(1,2-epoxy-1,2-dihydrophenyl)acetyl-CoA isomerase
MREQLALEAEIQQEMAGTADFVEGATAFAQRRQAAFQGR